MRVCCYPHAVPLPPKKIQQQQQKTLINTIIWLIFRLIAWVIIMMHTGQQKMASSITWNQGRRRRDAHNKHCKCTNKVNNTNIRNKVHMHMVIQQKPQKYAHTHQADTIVMNNLIVVCASFDMINQFAFALNLLQNTRWWYIQICGCGRLHPINNKKSWR